MSAADGLTGKPATTIRQAREVLEEILGEGFLAEWGAERRPYTRGNESPFVMEVVFINPQNQREISLTSVWVNDQGGMFQCGSNYGQLVL